MLTRTKRNTVTFIHPFLLKGVDRILPPGEYQVITDEELLEGLSFPVYRRVSTMILVPVRSDRTSSVEMLIVTPSDLRAAQDRDVAQPGGGAEVGDRSL
jgi:hypothetical protein